MVLRLITFLLFAPMCVCAQSNTANPFYLGHTEELYSEVLNERRVLNIYLPEGYDSNKTYPVIYLLDGGADEDFIHIAGIVQYNNFPWIDRVPQSILVGIANTDRKRDFTYPSRSARDKELCPTGGGSAKFMDFIEQEVQPFIKGNYAANNETTLIGQSLGGLLATEILFTRPMMFDKYIIISPSLWWDDGGLLKKSPVLLKDDYAVPTSVYVGVGKEGSMFGTEEPAMEEYAERLVEKISGAKSGKIRVYFDYLPDETHATAGHPAAFNAFRWLYPVKEK